jgi:hypothetical protein
MSHERKCNVDGQDWASISEACRKYDLLPDMIRKTTNRLGLEFDYHGHHFILGPRVNKMPEEYVDDPAPRVPKPKASPLDIAIQSRKMYDERGIARVGLLARRPA